MEREKGEGYKHPVTSILLDVAVVVAVTGTKYDQMLNLMIASHCAPGGRLR